MIEIVPDQQPVQKKANKDVDAPKSTVQLKKSSKAGTVRRKGKKAAPSGDLGGLASQGFGGTAGAVPHKAQMEDAFGTSFDNVQAYTDPAANKASRQMGAHAYAQGNQVAFADKNPSVNTVAHELTHVVQQAPAVNQKSAGDHSTSAVEAQADQVASAVASGGKVDAGEIASGAPMSVRKQDDDEFGTCEVPPEEQVCEDEPLGESDMTSMDSADDAEESDGSGDMSFQAAPKLSFKIGKKSFSISPKDGASVDIDLNEITFPKSAKPGGKDGFEKKQRFDVQLAPLAGVYFDAAAGASVKMGGKLSFKAKKETTADGDTRWSVTLGGSASVGGEIFAELGIGGFFGCSCANISAGFYAKGSGILKGTVGASGSVVHSSKEGWLGELKLDFEALAKVAVEVGVKANWKVLWVEGEFGRFSFGEWIIATGGFLAQPGVRFPGPVDISKGVRPHINLGTPPKAKRTGGSSRPTRSHYKGYCFTGATMVHTEDGMKAISDISAGDRVASVDPVTGQSVLTTVSEVQVHKGDFDMEYISVDGERLVTTRGHRFLRNGGWVTCSNLRDGDLLDGEVTVDRSAQSLHLTQTEIYNLKVADYGSYRVGTQGLVVRDH